MIGAARAGRPAPLRSSPGTRSRRTTGICTDLVTVARELSVARRALARAAADSGRAAGRRWHAALRRARDRRRSPTTTRYRRLVATVPGVTGEEVDLRLPRPRRRSRSRELGVARARPAPAVAAGAAGADRQQPALAGSGHRLVAATGSSSSGAGRRSCRRRCCADAAAYDARVAELIAAHAALDARSVYYWARLSPRYPTVEIRIADACLTVVDAVLLAGLSRCLVATAAADARADRPWIRVPDRAVTRAAFAAARQGLAAILVSPVSGRAAPAPEVLDELLAVIAPAAEAAGERAAAPRAAGRADCGGDRGPRGSCRCGAPAARRRSSRGLPGSPRAGTRRRPGCS